MVAKSILTVRFGLLMALCVIFLVGKCTAGDQPRTSTKANKLPAHWNPKNVDPLVNATQVWALGHKFFKGEEGLLIESQMFRPRDDEKAEIACEKYTFTGIDQKTAMFFNSPNLQPAVQFGCFGFPTPYEDALIEALKKGTPEIKIQSLAILLKLSAPSSVALQWETLGELRKLKDRAKWQPLLAEWRDMFDARKVRAELPAPSSEEFGRVPRVQLWNIRAAGVIRDEQALERLIELSRSRNLDSGLAAERSLEDFTGPKANQALAKCLLGWQNNFEYAGNALFKRDKELLVKVLLTAKPPAQTCRGYQGLWLGRCNNVASVPILCDEVPKFAIIDDEMFDHIGRLGRPEHTKMIEALLHRVRPDQRKEAERMVHAFMARESPNSR